MDKNTMTVEERVAKALEQAIEAARKKVKATQPN
jgi:hypothetical protein